MLLLLLAIFLNVSIVLVVSIYLSKRRPKACMFETKKLIDGIILWTICAYLLMLSTLRILMREKLPA
ncbi:hypothetical protein PTI98_000037 [Pleurotus ostreatus]|nr:hypothetical protein PTI98_000037 [Pleurotus ostreatus]